MKIHELLKKKYTLSMEVFPPKRDGDHKKLLTVVENLKHLSPDFISVTYGAGGSTQSLTQEIASEIKNQIRIEAMAHLTCVGNTQQEIVSILDGLRERGIENILALRGDPPQGQKEFRPVAGGFSYASDLIRLMKRENNYFSIGVAGYPEKHPDASSLSQDIENLKKKVDEGADFIITQLFFNNEHFYRFVDKIRRVGITLPVIPGIFLLSGYKQLQRIVQFSPVEIPGNLRENLMKNENDEEASKEIGIEFALRQSREMVKSGMSEGLHFYIMNREDMVLKIYEELQREIR